MYMVYLRLLMKRFFQILLSFFPYAIVFVGSFFSPSDPDLGWHLKYGEYFWGHHEILRENIFSTMMPLYHWANTDWGTDVLTYLVYHFGGFLGLSVLSSLLGTSTFYFFSRAGKLRLWDQALLFPLLLYLEQPVHVISFRGQLLSLFFLGVV